MPGDFRGFKLPKKRPRFGRGFTARKMTDCPYCPNKVRPGQPIVKDYEAQQYVHIGCFRRVEAAMKISNEEEETPTT